MNYQFNQQTAALLVQGQACPAPLVHHFVQEAYNTFNALQSSFIEIRELKYALQCKSDEADMLKEKLLEKENHNAQEKEIKEEAC